MRLSLRAPLLPLLLAGCLARAEAPEPGVPWKGQPGITESVATIMTRAGTSPLPLFGSEPDREGPGLRDFTPKDNPRSPASATWPAIQSTIVGGQAFAPQALGLAFGTIVIDEAPYIPPDTMGDVGPTQLLSSANGRIKVFSKTSGALGALNVTMDTFFDSVRGGFGTTDPHVRYDRLAARWFVLAVNIDEPNRVLLAVSSSATITDASSFTFFQFRFDLVGATPNSDSGGFFDYPTLGIDRSALYIGGDVYVGSPLVGTTGFVVNKAGLLAGSLTVTAFRQLVAGSGGAGPWSPQGVDNDDPGATEGYFIGTDHASFGTLMLRRVTNPGGAPAISANLALTVPQTSTPTSQNQMGAATRIDTIDDRLFAAAIHKNKITGAVTLTTAHNIRVTSAGAGCGGSCTGSARNASRWYEIGSLDTTPVLVQSGTLFDPAASNPRGYFIPSVVGTGQGHLALAASMAGPSDFASVIAAGRLRTDPPGATQAATLAQPGVGPYVLVGGSGLNRWGDFSQTDVDPDDDQTVWTFQEYCNAANSWAVYAVELKAPAPASPASASPSSICQGLSSVTVTIQGLSSGGTEFFDPGPDLGGPGYLRHISASVGGGVSVNGITFIDPTHVTLDLATVGSAAGAKNVTIKNPDQQSATGTGMLTVVATPTASASANGPLCEGATLQLAAPTIAGASYAWTGPNGFASSLEDPQLPGATPAAAGVYSLIVSVAGCASAPATTTVVVRAEGSPCDDALFCTVNDRCTLGSCAGTPRDCSALSSACAQGTCNETLDACRGVPIHEGEACDDGNPCTLGDACAHGFCFGAPGTPSEVTGLLVFEAPGSATLAWSAAPLATSYDVLRGDFAEWPVGPAGGQAGELCLADALSATTLSDAATPARGTGFWYVVRGENDCGEGEYGLQFLPGLEPAPRTSATCP